MLSCAWLLDVCLCLILSNSLRLIVSSCLDCVMALTPCPTPVHSRRHNVRDTLRPRRMARRARPRQLSPRSRLGRAARDQPGYGGARSAGRVRAGRASVPTLRPARHDRAPSVPLARRRALGQCQTPLRGPPDAQAGFRHAMTARKPRRPSTARPSGPETGQIETTLDPVELARLTLQSICRSDAPAAARAQAARTLLELSGALRNEAPRDGRASEMTLAELDARIASLTH